MDEEKLSEARFILKNEKLSKRIVKWDVPNDLRKKVKTGTLVGFSRWRNDGKPFVCIAQGKELVYLERPVFLEIAKKIKEI